MSEHETRTMLEDTSDVSLLGGPRVSLVIYRDDEVTVVELPEGEPVVIGRSEPADVIVPAPKLSRRHAQFTRLAEGGVKCEDLGSTNGTRHKGEPISEMLLHPGMSVTIGRVTVTINRTAGKLDLLQGIESYERFVERIEEEIERTRTLRRRVALMMVRAEGGEDSGVSEWLPTLREGLRPVDRIALYGKQAVLVLMPETDRERAGAVARAIAESDGRLLLGVAISGTSASVLLDEARTLSRNANPEARVVVASGAPRVVAGEPVFVSPPMIAIAELVERVARGSIPVLVTGEAGVGKEVVAETIHQLSPRSGRPMRVVDARAIDGEELMTLLFGDDERPGVFEEADGGTLFLDSIEALGDTAQAALLRVLESHTVTRGTREPQPVDVRVVAATSADLGTEEGFREELVLRLSALTIEVPPLRERAEDVDPLIHRFLEDAARAADAPLKTIDDDARVLLQRYPWPGNVRELRNVIERAVVASPGDHIGVGDLPDRLGEAPDVGAAAEVDDGFRDRVRAFETELIVDALEKSGGNHPDAARLLQLPLRTLVHKIESYGL